MSELELNFDRTFEQFLSQAFVLARQILASRLTGANVLESLSVSKDILIV